MDLLRLLADPGPVAKLQYFCGVEYEKPLTCDQQTQTRRDSSDSNDASHDQNGRAVSPGRRIASHGGDVDCLSSVHEGSDKETSGSRFYPLYSFSAEKAAEEYNNNLNKRASRNHLRYNSLNGTDELHVSNGYHISQANGKPYKKDIIECIPNPADVSHDDDGKMSGDSIVASTRGPAVQIKYRSLLYVARFGAFLGNELFYLTFFPFIIWNLDSLVVRQVQSTQLS